MDGIKAEGTESKRYCLTTEFDGSTMEMDHDSGYQNPHPIKDTNNVHYGWTLGQFVMSGFTDVVKEADGTPVFLVNDGDSIILSYELLQNIDSLNGRNDCRISDDTNGYDATWNVNKSGNGFGRGALLVKFTDCENKSKITRYFDYLTGVSNGRANTRISCLEEGDYEIILDYEVATSNGILGTYHDDYQTRTGFKVRNGNCMVYLKDEVSESSLANYAVAEEGFSIDFAKSRYLTVNVTCEKMTSNGYGISRSTVSCKPAYDGVSYTESGIYTVTVGNRYTHQEVSYTVSVGKESLANAYVNSKCEYTPEQIQAWIDSGESIITEDWRIEMIMPEPTVVEAAEEEPQVEVTPEPVEVEKTIDTRGIEEYEILCIIIAVLGVTMICLVIALIRAKKKNAVKPAEESEKE